MRRTEARIGSPAPRGFTLVEIMVVVVIIGLLAAIAIPAFQRVRHRAQNSAVVNGFRVFAQVFETYAMQNGQWPPNAGPGVLPAGVNTPADIKVNVWQSTTEIGGRWNWDFNRAEFNAGISISGFIASDTQLKEIDALLDDGDLTTGNFIKITSGTPRISYILEK